MASNAGWVSLSKLCEAIVDCEHKTAPIQNWGIPSIRTTNIKNGRLDIENANRVSEETYKLWTARLEPQPGDLILAREAPVGEVGIVPPNQRVCLGQRTVLIRPNSQKLHPRYLLYLLLTPEMRHEMISRAEGSVVPHLNMSDIRGLQIPPLPQIDEQKAIAHILGTLDDKIELNQQMNQTLESIARALFKSWFIDFDPVRAKLNGRQPAGMDAETAALFPDEFEDSAIGQIPKGWKVETINDATSLIIDHRGKTPLKLGGNWSEDGIPALSAKNIKSGRLIRNDAIRYVNQSLFDRWMKEPLSIRDILMTSEAPMGELLYLACNANYCLSQRLYGIRANSQKCQPAYLFYNLASNDTQVRLAGRATGTTVLGIRQSELRKVEILLPGIAVQQKFASIADPNLFQISSNEEQNYELALIRDALLPKLLSGEIRVKDAEKVVQAVA